MEVLWGSLFDMKLVRLLVQKREIQMVLWLELSIDLHWEM